MLLQENDDNEDRSTEVQCISVMFKIKFKEIILRQKIKLHTIKIFTHLPL